MPVLTVLVSPAYLLLPQNTTGDLETKATAHKTWDFHIIPAIQTGSLGHLEGTVLCGSLGVHIGEYCTFKNMVHLLLKKTWIHNVFLI